MTQSVFYGLLVAGLLLFVAFAWRESRHATEKTILYRTVAEMLTDPEHAEQIAERRRRELMALGYMKTNERGEAE